MAYFYISRKNAIDMGFTHEGSLFGAPAWFQGPNCESPAAPKFGPAILWVTLADMFYEAWTYVMRRDQMIEAPIKVTRPIPRSGRAGTEKGRAS